MSDFLPLATLFYFAGQQTVFGHRSGGFYEDRRQLAKFQPQLA